MFPSVLFGFFAKGLGWDSVLVIWIHGTLEISSIILSGAAGMIMGNSLLFPGTHKRIEALREAAKDGLKLLVGVVPMLVVAACLEGFVTRYSRSGMPLLLSLLILILSASWVIWYFVIYPMAHFFNGLLIVPTRFSRKVFGLQCGRQLTLSLSQNLQAGSGQYQCSFACPKLLKGLFIVGLNTNVTN